MDHHEGKLDELEGNGLEEPVVLDEIRMAKVYINTVNNWVKIPVLIQLELAAKVNIKVLDYQLNLSFLIQKPVWKPPSVKGLVRPQFKILKSWKIKHKKPTSFPFIQRESNFIILNVCNFVSNVAPFYGAFDFFPKIKWIAKGIS